MRSSRRVPALLAVLLAVVLGSTGTLAPAANAQSVDRLRSEITSAEPLTDSHRQEIASYIDHWTQRLQGDDDQHVTEARSRLLEPLRAIRLTQTFTQHYSEHLGEALLTDVMENDRAIVRLNAMIVVARLTSSAATPLIERGMQDDNAAVRYRAVKAIQNIDFSNTQKRELLDQLTDHLQNESETAVAEQVMIAMVDLDLPAARTRALELLNSRVATHTERPGRSLQAEHAGLQRVYHQLARAASPDSQAMQQLARAAVRYQDLAARQLQNESVDANLRPSHVSLIGLCNSILQFAADSLNASGTMPGSIQGHINQQNWDAIRRNADAWRNIMRRPPFDLAEQDLQLNN